MEQQRLDEIRARCDAATKGPWRVEKGKSFGVQSESKNIASCFRRENEDFIAHARTDVPDLLAEVARLTAELAAMTAERDRLGGQISFAYAQRDAANGMWGKAVGSYEKCAEHLRKARKQRDAWRKRAAAAELLDAIRRGPAECGEGEHDDAR